MYLRIAPELYLKRLTVGGFERVYEINRNFRNEGVSTQHNPEFTMLELYQAYADYTDLMEMIETLFQGLADTMVGSRKLVYQGTEIDLSQSFARRSIEDIILANNPDIDPMSLRDTTYLRRVCDHMKIPYKAGDGPGKLQIEIFERTGEHTLVQPTFAYAYPAEVSPLSRRNDADPFITDRWEFFVGGRELANGFSELNDAEDQAQRFKDQVERKDAGDEEAMYYDADYVRALEYGMPAGGGTRARGGPSGHAVYQFTVDSRRAAVSAPAARDLKAAAAPIGVFDSGVGDRRYCGRCPGDARRRPTSIWGIPRGCPTAPKARKRWFAIPCSAPPRSSGGASAVWWLPATRHRPPRSMPCATIIPRCPSSASLTRARQRRWQPRHRNTSPSSPPKER